MKNSMAELASTHPPSLGYSCCCRSARRWLDVSFACRPPRPAELPTCKMPIGSKTYQLEMARTSAEQEKGLMKRDSMPDNHGMIFVFDADRLQQFWMKDTRFPLDIIFLDHAGMWWFQFRYNAKHTTWAPHRALNRAQVHAIELNVGQAKTCGVEKGQTLKIPDVAQYKAK